MIVKRFALCLGLVLILSYCFLTSTFASEIQFLTHNIEGKTYKDKNGELRGKKHEGRRAFNLELVREIMIFLNFPRNFKEIPFKRGLSYVQNKKNYAKVH